MRINAKITSKGQITIPLRVRESLGVKEGDTVIFESLSPQEFRLRPAGTGSRLKGMLRPHLKKGQSLSVEQMNDVIAKAALRRITGRK